MLEDTTWGCGSLAERMLAWHARGPGFSWGVVVQAFNPSTREARQEDLRVGLVYKASSCYTEKPVLKKKRERGHEQHTRTHARMHARTHTHTHQ